MKCWAFAWRQILVGLRIVSSLGEGLGQVVRCDGVPMELSVELFALARFHALRLSVNMMFARPCPLPRGIHTASIESLLLMACALGSGLECGVYLGNPFEESRNATRSFPQQYGKLIIPSAAFRTRLESLADPLIFGFQPGRAVPSLLDGRE